MDLGPLLFLRIVHGYFHRDLGEVVKYSGSLLGSTIPVIRTFPWNILVEVDRVGCCDVVRSGILCTTCTGLLEYLVVLGVRMSFVH